MAKGLSPKPHVVALANLGTTQLLVHAWYIDHGGTFWHRSVVVDSPTKSSVAAGGQISFYMQDVSAVSIDTSPGAVQFEVRLNDRASGYQVSIGKDQKRFGDIVRTPIAWGLAPGIERITLVVRSGSLAVKHLVLGQLPRSSPRILASDVASRSPLLVVFGDSVGDGQRSLGYQQNSDGFAAQLAELRGWRLSQQTLPTATASCYGTLHVDDVLARNPDAVIVSFGASDLHPAVGATACTTSLDRYLADMTWILDQLHQRLPGVPIYVQSILPSTTTSKVLLKTWNDALRKLVLAAGVTLIDPSPELFAGIDYADLPNNRGHAKIAQFWNSTVPGLS